jgi:hypothetical protein
VLEAWRAVASGNARGLTSRVLLNRQQEVIVFPSVRPAGADALLLGRDVPPCRHRVACCKAAAAILCGKAEKRHRPLCCDNGVQSLLGIVPWSAPFQHLGLTPTI